ncbi:HpcH/HpaI aldolase/citrate lyase family protein [Sinorhizobium medicae]|uniref:HpcH/HpaI aldolase/citrate lyase family protein n=1 Tax=Sinorhizobium medicae TaxID=110321 RepID=UPI000FDBB6B2|nr:CoA ester lyase [Sinorhizobium medicae]RVO73509.1 CoA ester lyase [Sinorhizobium medicae]
MNMLAFTTALFVPGDRPERFAKAAVSGADAIIIDLEDAVAPENKRMARSALITAFTSLPIILRCNGAATRWHKDDLAAAATLNLAAIMLPKAEMDGAIDEIYADAAMRLPLIALIETARGVADARAIAAHPAVHRIAFGSIDFCADLGCAHERDALLASRSELVLASRLADLPAPVDGVTTVIEDADLIADDARHGRALGFGGKLCIHPKQIAPVRAGFRPDPAEIAWAKRVLATGEGAAAVDGAMVDEPVRARARKILALAD